MHKCVKCWAEITWPNRLWCNKCRKYVDEEFNGEIKRPYEFYFTYYIKHKWKSNVKVAEKK